MPILYKGDKTCTADKEQVELMLDAGWSKTKDEKPKSASTPEKKITSKPQESK